MKKMVRCSVLLLLCGVLGACSYDTLYSNLDEQQANEMLALLLRARLDGKKTQLDKRWALQITQSDLPAAVEILKSHGYPRDEYQSLGDVFKKEGFVSSPLEERARLLHGLSQELSRTISEIDGVLVARVHLAIPEKDVLSDERSPSSASIFIKHRTESSVDTQLSSIKALVVNSVEGLPYDNVTVTLFQAEPYVATAQSTKTVISPAPMTFDLKYLQEKKTAIFFGLLSLPLLVLIWLMSSRKKQGRKKPAGIIPKHVSH